MKALKILAGVLLFAALLFLFVANFSAAESRFKCSGRITANEADRPATIFLKLQKYRWWVGLWSDSRGSAWVELPNQTVSYFGHVTEAGDLLQFWESFGSPQNFSGNFSTLSGAIGVNICAHGMSDGNCEAIRNDA